jgi:hypothetical protein
MRAIALSVFFAIISLTNFGQSKMSIVAPLPEILKETSALVYYDKLFWTINDSGGEPEIYAFNHEGALIKQVKIDDAKNKDWEALAINKTHLFIGDFGNNFGMRKDLTIYAVKLDQLIKTNATVDFTIQFRYPEQNSWLKAKWNTPYDCEAMIATKGQIHLFTKDWKELKGAHYTLKIKEGEQDAKLLGTLNSNGLITDATAIHNDLYFIGYNDFIPIIWKYEFNNANSFIIRKTFNSNYKCQVEGITVVNDTLFITSEDSEIKPSLLIYPLSELK